MKNFKTLFGMAAVALIAASCTNDVSDVLAPEAPQQGIPFVATLAPKSFNATTRTLLTENSDGTISSVWEEGDEIKLYYGEDFATESIATVKKVKDDGSATIEATLESGINDGDEVLLRYAPGSFADQDGKLSKKLDIRECWSNFTVTDGVASLDGSVKMKAVGSIFKFTLQDLNGDELNVSEFTIIIEDVELASVTLASAANSFYVAFDGALSEDSEVWFTATDAEGNPYIAKLTTTKFIEPGYYYQTTLQMATVGDVILADGKFAAPKTEGAEAMIAYLGTEATDAPHGLAIALEDLGVALNWENAKSSANNWNSTHTINYGIWRLPSAYDWQRMFIACGSTNSYLEPLTDDNHSDMFISDDFRDKLMYAGNIDDSIDVDVKSQMYWTATEYGSYAWYYHFYTEKFGWNDTATGVYARAALAF